MTGNPPSAFVFKTSPPGPWRLVTIAGYLPAHETKARPRMPTRPEIRKWLGAVVGKEGETLDRHDRWLCILEA